MEILTKKITSNQLKQKAAAFFGNMVKAVVDIDRELIAIDAELHSDLEAMLLQDGSKQSGLWGINLYPEMTGDDRVEFDSMINLRPSQGNKSRSVENSSTRDKIRQVVQKWIGE